MPSAMNLPTVGTCPTCGVLCHRGTFTGPCGACYQRRIAALENEGLTTSDAQAVADVEIDRGTFPRNGGPEEVRDA